MSRAMRQRWLLGGVAVAVLIVVAYACGYALGASGATRPLAPPWPAVPPRVSPTPATFVDGEGPTAVYCDSKRVSPSGNRGAVKGTTIDGRGRSLDPAQGGTGILNMWGAANG